MPTDFSDAAFVAVEAAVEIAQAYGAIITLAHASSAVPFAAGEAVIPDLLVDQLADDEERMRVLVERLPALDHLHVETIVEYDAAVPMVHDLVKIRHPDLIVIGSSATRGIERVTLGSVAESIARSIPVPVLIMGPQSNYAGKLFDSIVVATDLKHTGLPPVQYASSIAERFHSRLVLLHVVEQDDGVCMPAEKDSSLLNELKALVPQDAAGYCVPEFQVCYGRPAEEVLSAARASNATLVVVGARRSTFLEDHLPWTTLSHIVREAGCGVLVVPNRVS